jgi:hypothetical protein
LICLQNVFFKPFISAIFLVQGAISGQRRRVFEGVFLSFCQNTLVTSCF